MQQLSWQKLDLNDAISLSVNLKTKADKLTEKMNSKIELVKKFWNKAELVNDIKKEINSINSSLSRSINSSTNNLLTKLSGITEWWWDWFQKLANNPNKWSDAIMKELDIGFSWSVWKSLRNWIYDALLTWRNESLRSTLNDNMKNFPWKERNFNNVINKYCQ